MSILTSLTRIYLTRSGRPFQFINTYTNSLEYKDEEKLGLYVHIPFCRSLCSFCPYCKSVYREEKARRYIASLLQEIQMTGSRHPEKKKATSLYFGGGTPALLLDDIGKIIQELELYFEINDGIGLELHPEDVTVEVLTKLKEAGVTKISIGIQSFQSEYLEMLGRKNIDYQHMLDALKAVPFETVSMDFIFALPGQTIETLKKDIETAFHNGANHVAIYPFIDFSFTERKFPRMSGMEAKKLLYDIVSYCESKGYVRDSIWTFSRYGDSKYSSMTRENFLGFGCSATTLLHGSFKINTFSLEEYERRIADRKLPTALTIHFTVRQRMIYYLFWTAYSMRVSPEEFKQFFGRKLEQCYGFELLLARILGFVRKENNSYVMTTKGSYYYHYYENYYTLSYIDQMWNLMRKEAFPRELIIR